MLLLPHTLAIFALFATAHSKYIEGTLRTIENWAFLARFCFLSERGEYEYLIEYQEEQGEINLLLYYDTEDQWPAVYKTGKSCREKEAVLNLEQNQVINLTTHFPYSKNSGCYFAPNEWTSAPPKLQTISIPTVATKRTTTTTTTMATTTTEEISFNETTTEDVNMQFEEIFENLEGFDGDNENVYENLERLCAKFDALIFLQETASTTTQKAPIKKRAADKKMLNRRIICRHSRKFRSSRERWWFIAVSNCNGTRGIELKYRILMTNGATDDYWHHHFSADEFCITTTTKEAPKNVINFFVDVLPVLMTSTVAYSFLLLAIVICTIELKSRQLLHSTYKLFVFSVVLQFIGILWQAMAFLKYAINGVGIPRLRTTGLIFTAASETCFLLLLLLLAKGYTITRGRLPVAASIKITIFMCLYIVTYLSLFIYETNIFDPGEVLYLYESPAGYGLITLRIFAWCMFIYSTVFTLKHYPEKSNFYYPFNIFGTLWFISGPAFILSANSYIDKWVRESVVCGVLLLIAFAGHLVFLILTMPSVANKNFPYHVRTTQIGIMEVSGAPLGPNTIDQFTHSLYEPTETVIIPLTRRTEEIFENMYKTQRQNNNTMEVAVINDDDGGGGGGGNVLAWSLAKNLPALENNGRHLMVLETSNQNSSASSRRNSFNFETTPQYNFDDYVRDVPVELFTVSKMVITAANLKIDEENVNEEHSK